MEKEKMILRTDKVHRFGKSINISGITVEFDNEGKCAIENIDDASKLIEAGLFKEGEKNVSAKIVDFNKNEASKIKELETEVESLKKELQNVKAQNEELKLMLDSLKPAEKKEEDDIISTLRTKSKKELIELCSSMEFPEAEYTGKTVAELHEYIIGKLSSEK